MRNAYLTTLGVLAAVLTVAALGTLVLPGVAGSVTADNDHGGPKFEARLHGSEEVPPVSTNTSGKAEFEFNRGKTELHFDLSVENGQRVQQAHIHCAPEGQNGPIIIFLGGFHDKGWDVDGNWIGDATATDANTTAAASRASSDSVAPSVCHRSRSITVRAPKARRKRSSRMIASIRPVR